jgi:hypothetical protein
MAVPRGTGSMSDHFKRDLNPIQTAIRVVFSLGLKATIAVTTYLIISQLSQD